MKKNISLAFLMLCFTTGSYATISCSKDSINQYRDTLELTNLKTCVARDNPYAKAVASYFYAIGIPDSPIEKNMVLSFKLARDSVVKGENYSLLNLAMHYQTGNAVKQGLDKAAYYFKECVTKCIPDTADDPDLKSDCEINLARLSRPTAKPFDLEIRAATIKDAMARFPQLKPITGNSISITNGSIFTLEPKYIQMTDLKDDVLFLFGKDGILDCIAFKLQKNKFADLRHTLKEKYKFIYDHNPRVGDKKMVSLTGNSRIILHSKHLSFETILEYQSMRHAVEEDDMRASKEITARYRQKQNL